MKWQQIDVGGVVVEMNPLMLGGIAGLYAQMDGSVVFRNPNTRGTMKTKSVGAVVEREGGDVGGMGTGMGADLVIIV